MLFAPRQLALKVNMRSHMTFGLALKSSVRKVIGVSDPPAARGSALCFSSTCRGSRRGPGGQVPWSPWASAPAAIGTLVYFYRRRLDPPPPYGPDKHAVVDAAIRRVVVDARGVVGDPTHFSAEPPTGLDGHAGMWPERVMLGFRVWLGVRFMPATLIALVRLVVVPCSRAVRAGDR